MPRKKRKTCKVSKTILSFVGLVLLFAFIVVGAYFVKPDLFKGELFTGQVSVDTLVINGQGINPLQTDQRVEYITVVNKDPINSVDYGFDEGGSSMQIPTPGDRITPDQAISLYGRGMPVINEIGYYYPVGLYIEFYNPTPYSIDLTETYLEGIYRDDGAMPTEDLIFIGVDDLGFPVFVKEGFIIGPYSTYVLADLYYYMRLQDSAFLNFVPDYMRYWWFNMGSNAGENDRVTSFKYVSRTGQLIDQVPPIVEDDFNYVGPLENGTHVSGPQAHALDRTCSFHWDPLCYPGIQRDQMAAGNPVGVPGNNDNKTLADIFHPDRDYGWSYMRKPNTWHIHGGNSTTAEWNNTWQPHIPIQRNLKSRWAFAYPVLRDDGTDFMQPEGPVPFWGSPGADNDPSNPSQDYCVVDPSAPICQAQAGPAKKVHLGITKDGVSKYFLVGDGSIVVPPNAEIVIATSNDPFETGKPPDYIAQVDSYTYGDAGIIPNSLPATIGLFLDDKGIEAIDVVPLIGPPEGVAATLDPDFYDKQTNDDSRKWCPATSQYGSPRTTKGTPWEMNDQCIVCGDGVREGPNEACDDGNLINGDGCSDECLLERCGDEIIQPKEECEPPGTATCDDECKTIHPPECGNGTKEGNEECDDGNLIDWDGCSSECIAEFCGDGKIQLGLNEICDDGNKLNEDGCNDECRDEYCGDDIVQFGLGEQCELPGTQVCDAQCKTIVPPVCGDNKINAETEECDDGNTLNDDGCSSVCKIEICGDNIKQASEECDDGNVLGDDGCSAECKIEKCDDGVVQPSLGEQCERPNTPTCDAQCRTIQLPTCGDGQVNRNGEECDDGNNVNGDGCSSACRVEKCGDGVVNRVGEECDDGNNVSEDGCSDECKKEECGDAVVQAGLGEQCEPPNTATCDAQCQTIIPPVCGDGKVNAAGEACDDGNVVNNDGCSAECKLEVCGDGVKQTNEECDDGNNNDEDGCSSECKEEKCGDNVIQQKMNEQCELPNTVACNAQCQIIVQALCGDGKVNDPNEDCDDGNKNNNDGCNAQCKKEFCGDTITQLALNEECDDGNNNNNDGCSDECKKEECGDGVVQAALGEECEPPNSATCDNDCKKLPVCGDGVRSPSEACDDGNLKNNDGCNDKCKKEVCGDGVVQNALGEDCEPPNTATCDAGCKNIPVPRCGDGRKDPGEDCDDGNLKNNDGCSAVCTKEFCGDNVVQVGEDCEPPGTAICDAKCKTIIPPACGDGKVDLGEQCDDGNTKDNDGCNAKCEDEFCGDTIVQNALGEQCELPSTATCDIDCKVIVQPACGDGKVDPGEDCDDGNVKDNDGCSALCKDEICGDNIIQATEQCEPPNTPTCDANCIAIAPPACGDGNVDPGEDCDPPVAGMCSPACKVIVLVQNAGANQRVARAKLKGDGRSRIDSRCLDCGINDYDSSRNKVLKEQIETLKRQAGVIAYSVKKGGKSAKKDIAEAIEIIGKRLAKGTKGKGYFSVREEKPIIDCLLKQAEAIDENACAGASRCKSCDDLERLKKSLKDDMKVYIDVIVSHLNVLASDIEVKNRVTKTINKTIKTLVDIIKKREDLLNYLDLKLDACYNLQANQC